REWLSLPTASPGVCRRNLLRRPSGEPVSIPPLTPLQPARRGKDVQPARDRQISHRAHIQVHADCVDAVQAQRFMRYCWADQHGLSGVRCDRSNRSGKSLYACQYNGDLNLVMEMSRQRRAHITAPNGLLDAAPLVETGIRPYVCNWHTALLQRRMVPEIHIKVQAICNSARLLNGRPTSTLARRPRQPQHEHQHFGDRLVELDRDFIAELDVGQ